LIVLKFEILSKNARTELALSQKIATDTDVLISMLKYQADGDNYNLFIT
jgi:hypothetical protein